MDISVLHYEDDDDFQGACFRFLVEHDDDDDESFINIYLHLLIYIGCWSQSELSEWRRVTTWTHWQGVTGPRTREKPAVNIFSSRFSSHDACVCTVGGNWRISWLVSCGFRPLFWRSKHKYPNRIKKKKNKNKEEKKRRKMTFSDSTAGKSASLN